jgi:uncharacterized surface protein with fasciclin (FAS1) repeats
MKRTALVAGLLLAAVVFVPGSVSAHSYESHNSDWNGAQHASWTPSHYNDEYDNGYDYQSEGTIVDSLVNDGSFTTLITAVQAAGLAETLSASGDLTVFAPTDEAFAKLPAGTVEALLADKAALTTVLTNHVVSGRVDGETAIWAGEAPSLAGNMLNIGYGDDGVLYVNDAAITITDIHTSNGVVHVIDAVLVP